MNTPLKTVAAILLLSCAAASTLAAAPLYSNASANPSVPALATGSTAANNVPAPAGLVWSELQKDAAGFGNAIAGFSAHAVSSPTAGFRFADDFLVTSPGWRLSSASFYAYQTGAPASSFPFDRVTIRIWSGSPAVAGSRIVYGNTATNSFIAATPTNIYRIFSTTTLPLPTTTDLLRKVWKIDASLNGVSLAPGRYWIDWQFSSSIQTTVRALLPAATILGARGVPGANALQLASGSSSNWVPVVDTGKPDSAADVPQDFPFILIGDAAPPPCAGDINNDNRIDGRDLSVLLANFGATVPAGTGGDLNASGQVNGADVSVLLSNFGNQC